MDIIEKNSDCDSESENDIEYEETNECLCYGEDKDNHIELVKK